jgi:signal transduction histidine kinase
MRSLRARLFLAIALAVLVSIGLTLGIGTLLIRRSVERAVLHNLARQADVLAARQGSAPLDPAQLQQLRVLFRRQGVSLRVVDRPPGLLPGDQRRALEQGHGVDGRGDLSGRPVLYSARPAGGRILLLIRPARLGASDWRPFLGGFLVAGLIGAGIAGLASFLLARAIARPVGRVAEASRSLAAGTSPGPIPLEGSDELAGLAASFNEMAGEIERAREAEQAFLLSVSHELKTPLTAIRGYAEGLAEGAVEPGEAGAVIKREAGRLERLVQDVLDLARLNRHAFAVRSERVDLRAVVGEAVRRHEPAAREFGVTLVAEAAEGSAATGDADRVLQVVSNLVENAVRATPAGGRVTIGAGPGTVSVRDTGPGLPTEELNRAFERFFLYRRHGPDRAVGSGLGLAVVKELAEAMGGSVSVSSEPGRGTVFVVTLPGKAPRDGQGGGPA